MKIEHNSYQLMDNLRIDEIQVYGAPSNISDVYVDHFVKFFDFNYDTVSILCLFLMITAPAEHTLTSVNVKATLYSA